MKTKIVLLFFIILPSLLWCNDYYYFQDITKNFDLSNAAVNTVCEDENGFVWFGTINGLYFHNSINIEKVALQKHNNGSSELSRVAKIYRDSRNDLWVCSDKGLFKYKKENNSFEFKILYDKKSQKRVNETLSTIVEISNDKYLIQAGISAYIYQENDSILRNISPKVKGNFSYVHKDKNGIIYLGLTDGRLYFSRNNLETIELLYQASKRRVTAVCKDGSKYYIGFSGDGVDIINPNGTRIGELNSQLEGKEFLNDNHIRQIIKRKNGDIWIATHIGISIIGNDNLTLLDSSPEVGLPHRTIFTMQEGNNNSVWVGTYSGGLAYYSESNFTFKYIPIEYDRKQSVRSDVSSFCEDANGHIWVGSEDDGGIKVYDPNINDFNPNISSDLDDIKGIKTITTVDDDLIAIGRTFSKQVLLYNYNKRQVEASIGLPLKAEPGILGIKYIENKIWALDRLKLISYNLHTQEVQEISTDQGRIWQLYYDSSHSLWISSSKGLYLKNPGTDKAQKVNFNGSSKNISEVGVYSVSEDKDGRLWVGTMGKGLFIYSPEKGDIIPAPNYELTKDADIYSLIRDHDNNTWYNTSQGLYRYDTNKMQTDYYGANDGISNKRTIPNSAYCSEDGLLYFGTTNGFNVINPRNIRTNPIPPSVFLAGININNKPYTKDSLALLNTLSFNPIKNITLSAQENTLGFSLVSNNYIKTEKNKFKYRLINYDDNWVEIAQNQDIVFTKVPPGSYTFEAIGSNNDNHWSETPYQLAITIRPPFYGSWYALLFYLILTLVLAYVVTRELKSKIKLKKEISEERYKSQAKDLINSERVKFFTNISHELRTPLSLVMSPIKSLLQKDSLDEQSQHLLNVADRNAQRLLKIADQTLDFRLLELGKLDVSLNPQEITQLTKGVYLCFEQQIIDRQIDFSYTSDFNRLEITVDGDMVEKIIYNLLSNALKYTPEKESISLSISKCELSEDNYKNVTFTGNKFLGEAVAISVKDTGSGIKSELLPHIFERFSKGEEGHKTSSGIGLHLCKEYASMNNGNMLLTTEVGKGSSFTLNLPLTEDTSYESGLQKQRVKKAATEKKVIPELVKINNSKQFTVLIVEDNSELRHYLKIFLEDYFKVITAKSGELALAAMEDIVPDLIISDVSMPGISGIEFTKNIKEDPQKQHIPVFIMTAYIDRDYQMESVLSGADAFFTKPINEALLLAQINNSLKKSLDIQNTKAKQSTEDVSFLEKVQKIIEDNLQNPEFEIQDLSKQLKMSKTTLSRKLKAETQLSPSAFIRDVRLESAVDLIRTKKFNILEIAAYVGFNSTSYFIRTFKTKYGVTPNEYREQMK